MSSTSQPKEEEEEEEEHYRNDDIININEKDKLLMTMASSSSTMASSSSTMASSSSSPAWLTSKDPRIVRVSRAFGGKDRHSKVCTVRGLRDRRVRLSVPTAIQLYDLQDKLGLNQPSKVVDWLLNVAKDEIDELPPLPENFINGLNTQSLFIKPNNNTSIENWEGSNCRLPISNFSRTRAKQVANDQTLGVQQNETKQEGIILNDDDHEEQVSSNRANNHAFGMLNNNNNNNNVMSFVYHHHNWEPNLNNYPYSTSNLGSQEMLTDFHHNLNDVSLPSNTLSLSSSSGSQFLVSCPPPPPPGATQTYFPSHDSSSSSRENIDPRQVNQFLMLSSSTSSQTLYPNNSLSMSRPSFHFSTNTD